MKTRLIELKKVEEGATVFDYRAGLQQILEAPADPKGLTFGEIKTRIDLMDLLADSGDTLLLPEEQFNTLKRIVEANRFPKATRLFWNFIQDIQNAPQVDSELRAVTQ